MEVEDIMILEGYLTWDDVYGEGSAIQRKTYNKLNRSQKTELKSIAKAIIGEYWDVYHIIPVDNEYKKLKESIIQTIAHEIKIRIKEEKIFNGFLQSQVIAVINRHLKEENKGRYKTPNIQENPKDAKGVPDDSIDYFPF